MSVQTPGGSQGPPGETPEPPAASCRCGAAASLLVQNVCSLFSHSSSEGGNVSLLPFGTRIESHIFIVTAPVQPDSCDDTLNAVESINKVKEPFGY